MNKIIALIFLFMLFGCNVQKVNPLVDKVGKNENIQNEYWSIRKKRATYFLKYQNSLAKLESFKKVYNEINCESPNKTYSFSLIYPEKEIIKKSSYTHAEQDSSNNPNLKSIVKKSKDILDETKTLLFDFMKYQTKNDSIDSAYKHKVSVYHKEFIDFYKFEIKNFNYKQCEYHKGLVQIYISKAKADLDAHRSQLMILYRPNKLKRFFKTERYQIYENTEFQR